MMRCGDTEPFMFIGNQFDRIFTSAGKARFAPWPVRPQAGRNAVRRRENPAFGGPNRPVGRVAALARCTAPRLAERTDLDHQMVPYEHETLYRI